MRTVTLEILHHDMVMSDCLLPNYGKMAVCVYGDPGNRTS